MTELEKTCLKLPRHERERLADLLIESIDFWMTGKSFEEQHQAIVKVMGQEILVDSRSRHLMIGKTLLAYACHKEGMTETEIGEYMNRNHASIHHRINRAKEWLSMPKLFKLENECFNKLIQILDNETDRRTISEPDTI